MKFPRGDIIALILIILLFMNELGHLPFKGIYFNGRVTLNTSIYYFTLAFRNEITSIIFLILLWDYGRSTRSLITGVIGWNSIELYQEYCYLAKIDEKVLYFNDGLYGQIAFICLLILLVYFGRILKSLLVSFLHWLFTHIFIKRQ